MVLGISMPLVFLVLMWVLPKICTPEEPDELEGDSPVEDDRQRQEEEKNSSIEAQLVACLVVTGAVLSAVLLVVFLSISLTGSQWVSDGVGQSSRAAKTMLPEVGPAVVLCGSHCAPSLTHTAPITHPHCTHHSHTAPITHTLHPSLTHCTHHSHTAPIIHTLHQSLTHCTHHSHTAPITHTLHPSLTHCAPPSLTLYTNISYTCSDMYFHEFFHPRSSPGWNRMPFLV